MTFVPRGKSTAINADGVLGRDVADDEALAIQAAGLNGLQELAVSGATGQDLAVCSRNELPPVATLQLGIRNRFDGHRKAPLGLCNLSIPPHRRRGKRKIVM